MSKKENKKNKKGGDSKKIDYEESHKAVIIGETFTNYLLKPLTDDTPNLLLPICGIPIIELMLDSLSSSNIIKEIIICIKKENDAKQIEKYLKKYHKNLCYRILINEEFNCVGDCLRKIFAEKLISNDFILIRGLVITNADIDELYNIHMANKSKDKNCLITSVMKKYKNTNEIKTDYDENILIYDDNTKKIYQYESTFQEDNRIQIYETINNKKTNINNNYIIRGDLFETGIDICSHEFLNIINENFEFKSIRDSIKNVLEQSELYLDTFYVYDLGKDLYCGLIRNIESYLKINFEILNRWAYPIVIDNIDMSSKLKINLKQIGFSLYSDKDTNSENYHKANLISEVVILDNKNTIGKDSKLQKCILCKDVKVGKNCNLNNCIIFEGSEIEDGVEIKNSIIGNNCIIKKGIKIISSVLGKEINLDKDSIQERIFYEDEGENINNNLTIFNRDLFLTNLDDNEILFLPNKSSIYGFNKENLVNEINKEKGNNNLENEEINKNIPDSEEFFDEESISSESSELDEKDEDNYSDLVTNIVSSGIDNETNIDDMVKELGNLKNSYYTNTFEETMKICLSIIITKFLNGEKFSKNHIKTITKLFKDWKPLFKRFVPNKDVELHLISVIEQLCIEIPEISSAFHILIQILNSEDCDVIGDDAIISWNGNSESFYTELSGTVYIPLEKNEENKKKMAKFIETILENNDEDEEEEEDEEKDGGGEENK